MMANEERGSIGDTIVRLIINVAGVVIMGTMSALVIAAIVQELD